MGYGDGTRFLRFQVLSHGEKMIAALIVKAVTIQHFFHVLSLGGVDRGFKKLGPRMIRTFGAGVMLHVSNVRDDFLQLFLRPFDRTFVASTFSEPPMVPLPRSSKFVNCNGHRDILQLSFISGVSLGL